MSTSVTLPLGNPLRTIFRRRPDLRNHRKITLIDGRICHCGSQNCADPAFLPKAKFARWVDVMAWFEGPVSHQMNLLFAQNWLADDPGELAAFRRRRSAPGRTSGATWPHNCSRASSAQPARGDHHHPLFCSGEEVCSAILAAAHGRFASIAPAPQAMAQGTHGYQR